jgi:hypothetical protein
MATEYDVREVVTGGVTKGARSWGIGETTISSNSIKEVVELGDEVNYLNTLGLSPTEDGKRLERLAAFLESKEGIKALQVEDQHWQASGIVNTAIDCLPRIAESLTVEASPGRIGCLLRAIPVLAGSRSSPLAYSLSRVLKVEPLPSSLIAAYSEAFCKREETVLTEVDRLIISDRALGPLALNLTGHILKYLGWDGFDLDAQSRKNLIDCLTLLVCGVLEKDATADT